MAAIRRLCLVTAALSLVSCTGTPHPTSAGDGIGAIVLVSGRDDHGLLQMHEVPLRAEPEGTEITAHLPDGSFAEVLEIRGTWLRIRSVADRSRSGWVDDFLLRDRAVLHDGQQVRFLGARVADGGIVQIEVQAIGADGPPRWVAGEELDEVGADLDSHEG